MPVCIPGCAKHSLHTLDSLEAALSPPSLDLDNLVLLEVEETNNSLILFAVPLFKQTK